MPSGGHLGPLGHQGPARGVGRPLSRATEPAWAGHPATGKAAPASSLGEGDLEPGAAGVGAAAPRISRELGTSQPQTASPR